MAQVERRKNSAANPDPITGQLGAHPLGLGVGEAAGGATAGAVASAARGPLASAIGAALGGVVGRLGWHEYRRNPRPDC